MAFLIEILIAAGFIILVIFISAILMAKRNAKK
jgi:ABC-type antimicrobial peptide transport system permease subunit